MTVVLPLVIRSFGLIISFFKLSVGRKEQALSGRYYKIIGPFLQDSKKRVLGRKPQCIDNGDVELRRQNGTKENEALFTALPEGHPCKRLGIIHVSCSMRMQWE